MVAWLLSWADDDYQNVSPEFHALGRDLLRDMAQIATLPRPCRVDVKTQHMRVDICCFINETEHVLIIEDKILTSQHSKQLDRYRHDISKAYCPDRLSCIYFKMHDQSSYEDVRESGFSPYTRAKILKIINRNHPERLRKNPIFSDFENILRALDDKIQNFEMFRFADWDNDNWKGFFLRLQKEIEDLGWDYVAATSGGFWGCWWSLDSNKGLYCQIEGLHENAEAVDGKIRIKLDSGITQSDYENRSEVSTARSKTRDKMYHVLLDALENSTLDFKKPKRFGVGRHMTLFYSQNVFAVEDGYLNLDQTLRNIYDINEVMKNAFIALNW